MNLFGKKKEEDEFDDEESLIQEEELENKKLKKQLKDLHAENRKKRKEPPKPWGKKERFIVGGFFILTTITAMVMFLFSHDFKFPGLPRIVFKGIDFKNPFEPEVIQIGQKGTVGKDDIKAQAATDQFRNYTKPISGHYGFLVIRLTSGEKYGVSNTETFQGASLLKLPLMVLAYKMDEEGSLDLDTEYVLKDSDKVDGSGVLINAKAGTTYTYRKLVEYMGKNSDRTAYKVMKDVVGSERLKNYLDEIGMDNTNIDTGETTPDDMGLIFQKLWSGDLVNNSNKDEVLGYLRNTIYEEWITAGVPDGIPVAHKFGQDVSVTADAGIIESPDPYILVIMAQGTKDRDTDTIFPKFSRDIYNIENDVQLGD